MFGNMNVKNNHPFQALTDENDKINNVMTDRKQQLEETKDIVRRFLERTISQNAKSPSADLKPEGYHKLKQNGKLPGILRQQSKPEPNSHYSRKTYKRKLTATATPNHVNKYDCPDGPVSASLPRINTESNSNLVAETAVQSRAVYMSELDVSTMQRIYVSENNDVPPESSMMMQLLASNSQDQFYSFDSTQSSCDGKQMRRKSFTKAVSQMPMFSSIENPNNTTSEMPIQQEIGDGPHSKIESHVEISHHVNRESSLELPDDKKSLPIISAQHGCKDEERPEKKKSFRDRVEKFLRRKTRSKKRFDFTAVESSIIKRRDENHPQSAGPRTTMSIDEEFKRATEKQRRSSSTHQDPFHLTSLLPKRSPSKRTSSPLAKFRSPHGTPNLLRRAFSHKKSSPKLKPKGLHQSSSSHSLSHSYNLTPISEQMEKNKSGSLPNSIRLSVAHQQLASFSSDQDPVNLAKIEIDPEKQLQTKSHYKEVDINKKLKGEKQERGGKSKIRRLINIFRKRHVSESSVASSRSLSEPSLHAAVESETTLEKNSFHVADDQNIDFNANQRSGITTSSLYPDNFSSEQRYFHHRSSFSMSSVHVDKMTDAERERLSEEVVETLSRVSSKFAKHMQRRAAQRNLVKKGKETSSDVEIQKSTSNCADGSKDHSPCHLENNEMYPALAAYYNLNHQKKKVEGKLGRLAAVMPKSTPARIYHSKSSSLDSDRRYVRNFSGVPNIIVQKPSPKESRKVLGDVVDGFYHLAESGGQEAISADSADDFHTEDSDVCSLGRDIDSCSRCDVDELVIERESNVDMVNSTSQVPDADEAEIEAQPSTSTVNGPYIYGSAHRHSFDEDKLVEKLVSLLCKKGDEIFQSVEAVNGFTLSPVDQRIALDYFSRASYEGFRHFARRLTASCKQCVERSPSRHPEIFSVIMVANMAQMIFSATTSDLARQAYNRVSDYVGNLIFDIFGRQGNPTAALLSHLRDAERELSEADDSEESPPSNYDDVD